MTDLPADIIKTAEWAAMECAPDVETIDQYNKRFITIARAIQAERQRCAMIADTIAKETGELGISHPEDSPSRDRCFARSRTAHKIAGDIRGIERAEQKYRITWNEARTFGVIVKDDRDGECEFAQLAYELRKGSLNPLGVVSSAFMDAWGDMTANDNCTIQDVTIPAP